MIGRPLCGVEGADAVCGKFERGNRRGGHLGASSGDFGSADFDADGRAVYRTKRFSADPLLMLVIARGDCRDGMSDTRYPGSAVLTRGDSTWRGCATVVPDSLQAR